MKQMLVSLLLLLLVAACGGQADETDDGMKTTQPVDCTKPQRCE